VPLCRDTSRILNTQAPRRAPLVRNQGRSEWAPKSSGFNPTRPPNGLLKPPRRWSGPSARPPSPWSASAPPGREMQKPRPDAAGSGASHEVPSSPGSSAGRHHKHFGSVAKGIRGDEGFADGASDALTGGGGKRDSWRFARCPLPESDRSKRSGLVGSLNSRSIESGRVT
jgi:hypothetical protein